MTPAPQVEPLSLRHRSAFFYLLLTIFLIALPFLFLYATGYRFNFDDTSFVSTGGLYVAAERTGAEIYIDGELVRETRVFRRAFYAQSIEPGTHRVHVQKEGYHTWVKDLPVYAHLVTEAQAFNLPEVSQIRLITPLLKLDRSLYITATSSVMQNASTTNEFVISTTTLSARQLVENEEFLELESLFIDEPATTTAETAETFDILGLLSAEETAATTTKVSRGVKLYEEAGEVWAAYVGERGNMPYYYCAEEFELLGTSTPPLLAKVEGGPALVAEFNEDDLLQPVQEVAPEVDCDPVIKIDRQGQTVTSFEFFPGSSDFVLLARADGVYMVEVDDRAWQNAQPILLGENLDLRVVNNQIYIYDGKLIYELQLENQL